MFVLESRYSSMVGISQSSWFCCSCSYFDVLSFSAVAVAVAVLVAAAAAVLVAAFPDLERGYFRCPHSSPVSLWCVLVTSSSSSPNFSGSLRHHYYRPEETSVHQQQESPPPPPDGPLYSCDRSSASYFGDTIDRPIMKGLMKNPLISSSR